MTSPRRWLLGATSDSACPASTVDGVASAISVNQPLRARAPVLTAIDGEPRGDHAFSSLERDPYSDDGGES
jgi:hypothetical protein